MFEKTKINEKEAGVGPFFENEVVFCDSLIQWLTWCKPKEIVNQLPTFGLDHLAVLSTN